MPMVNFFACLDLEQNISFLNRHLFNLIISGVGVFSS